MRKEVSGKCLNKYVPDYVLFDLETTGISTRKDEVVEISALKVKGGKVVEEFSQLVNPGFPIPFQASEVNGITDDMVADCPKFDVVLKDFLEFVGDAVLVGHNIKKFDMVFIQRDVKKYFDRDFENDYIDTLPLARTYLPELDHHRLTDLAQHYGIATEGAHRALNDCHMNRQVFEHLHEELEHPSEAAKAVKKCPRCGSAMSKRNGKFGEFWGCSGYPDCKYTENI